MSMFMKDKKIGMFQSHVPKTLVKTYLTVHQIVNNYKKTAGVGLVYTMRCM